MNLKFLSVGLVAFTFWSSVSAAEPEKEKKEVSWQKDELCQFVFFAVLEGLYRDGVQNEVVDAILGKAQPDSEESVKSHFVFRCELCHATYEAFRTYRARPSFLNATGQSTFGEGLDDPKLMLQLKSEFARTRVYAMGSLVRPWILHRVEETRKTPEEKMAMRERLRDFANEGAKLLRKHREEDELYLDWDFYGSCQACEAAEDLGE